MLAMVFCLRVGALGLKSARAVFQGCVSFHRLGPNQGPYISGLRIREEGKLGCAAFC